MAMSNFVITIGREFGSNGKKIGEEVAKRLGIKCYDKELLSLAAKDSGFCEEILESNDEKPTRSFLYSLVMDTYSMNHYSTAPFLDMPLNQKVFLAQYVRIAEVCKRMDISVNKAKDMIQKQDKQRASYYNYYSNKKWGDSRNYHLTLDSSVLGIDGCVDMILACREKMLEKK